MKILFFVLKIMIALILIPLIGVKLTAHPDSIAIFQTLHQEPVGRYFAAFLEMLFLGTLFFSKTLKFSLVLGICLMIGAVFSHLFILGIILQNDQGLHFIKALLILCICLILTTFELLRSRSTKPKL